MRFDLIVNAMYKSCLLDQKIVINNPSIWRPIIDIRDVVRAYFHAIQADRAISGVFNLIANNYTVGEVGMLVKGEMERILGKKIVVETYDIHDFRNYRVTSDKATATLGFTAQYSIPDIVHNIHQHREEYGEFNKDEYYNIRQFQKMFSAELVSL